MSTIQVVGFDAWPGIDEDASKHNVIVIFLKSTWFCAIWRRVAPVSYLLDALCKECEVLDKISVGIDAKS